MFLRSLMILVCTAVLATAGIAQVNTGNSRLNDKMPPETKPIASPPAMVQVSLNGKDVKITYNSPSMRGRKIMGQLVPYGKVWRTGANSATTLIAKTNLKVGTLSVPAGTYTLFTLPSADTWQLIVSKDTGEWGLAYKESSDLGRTPMKSKMLSSPQEKMSISFENTKGNSTELHVKWEKTDEYVDVTAE